MTDVENHCPISTRTPCPPHSCLCLLLLHFTLFLVSPRLSCSPQHLLLHHQAHSCITPPFSCSPHLSSLFASLTLFCAPRPSSLVPSYILSVPIPALLSDYLSEPSQCQATPFHPLLSRWEVRTNRAIKYIRYPAGDA